MVNHSFSARDPKLIACAIATLFAVGCTNPFSGGDCVSLGVYAITATVVDASTNRAPVTVPAMRVEDGAYVEEHAMPFPGIEPPIFSAANERPGTYRVTLSAAGYQNYVRDNIRVTRGGKCDALSGVRLAVRLVRSM